MLKKNSLISQNNHQKGFSKFTGHINQKNISAPIVKNCVKIPNIEWIKLMAEKEIKNYEYEMKKKQKDVIQIYQRIQLDQK